MSLPPEKNAAQIPRIRPERPADAADIYGVHAAAFSTTAEAQLVEALRRDGDLAVSLVAELAGTTELAGAIVGHIALSPVTLSPVTRTPATRSRVATGVEPCLGVGLAPVAVLAEYQRRGIGAQLIEAGLTACDEAGFSFAVVLGEPAYYGRFGFRAASDWGLESEYDAGDAFMARSLGDADRRPAALPRDGQIRYAAAFASLG